MLATVRTIDPRWMIARCPTAAQGSLTYRPLKSAKRTGQLWTELRLAQERDFAPTKARQRRRIARPEFVCRQIVPRAVARKVLASNRTAEQAA
jgi:hypothetical protein